MAPLHAWVELSHHLDADRWPELHRAGEVPSSTPLGIGDLARHGFDVTFRPNLRGRLSRRAARAIRNRFDNVEWVESFAALRHPQYRRADVILCWTEFFGIPAAFRSALTAGAPLVLGAAHLTDPAERTARFLWAAKHALERADAVFVQSEAMIPVLRSIWGLKDVPIEYVPFGVDAEYFVPSREEIQREMVVSVGDDRYRDHETLIEAIARVRETDPSVRLELATHLPATMPPEVGLLIPESLGPRRRRFYGTAAVVAIATRPNAYGSGLSVLLEAMACGRPYVITAAAGVAEYVRHGEDGLVVPPGDVDALAEAVGALIVDPERADALGRAGRLRLERELTTEVQARELARVLRAAAAR